MIIRALRLKFYSDCYGTVSFIFAILPCYYFIICIVLKLFLDIHITCIIYIKTSTYIYYIVICSTHPVG